MLNLSPPVLILILLNGLHSIIGFSFESNFILLLKVWLGGDLSQLGYHLLIDVVEVCIFVFIAQLYRIVDLVSRQGLLALNPQLFYLLLVEVALSFSILSPSCTIAHKLCLLLVLLEKKLLSLHIRVITFRIKSVIYKT